MVSFDPIRTVRVRLERSLPSPFRSSHAGVDPRSSGCFVGDDRARRPGSPPGEDHPVPVSSQLVRACAGRHPAVPHRFRRRADPGDRERSGRSEEFRGVASPEIRESDVPGVLLPLQPEDVAHLPSRDGVRLDLLVGPRAGDRGSPRRSPRRYTDGDGVQPVLPLSPLRRHRCSCLRPFDGGPRTGCAPRPGFRGSTCGRRWPGPPERRRSTSTRSYRRFHCRRWPAPA